MAVRRSISPTRSHPGVVRSPARARGAGQGLIVHSWAEPAGTGEPAHGGTLRPSRLDGPGSPLRGRDREQRVLTGYLESLTSAGSALVVCGETGIGKTRLLEWAGDTARDLGYRLLAGGAAPGESGLRYAGLHRLLLPLFEEALDAAGPPRSAPVWRHLFGSRPAPVPQQLAVLNAVRAALADAARARPILLLIDDLPRVDPASLEVLSRLARRLSGVPVGLLATSSEREAREGPFADLDRLRVGRVSRSDAEQMVTDAAPALSARDRVLIAEQADGNPLAVAELTRAVLERPQTPWLAIVAPRSERLDEQLRAVVARAHDSLRAGAPIVAARQSIEAAVTAQGRGRRADDPELTAALEAWLLLCWLDGRAEAWAPLRRALDRLDPGPPAFLQALVDAFTGSPGAPAIPGTAAPGAPAPVAERIRAALVALAESGDPARVALLTTAAMHFDLFPLCRPSGRRVIDAGRDAPPTPAYLGALAQLCFDDIASGHWREAQAFADEGAEASGASRATVSPEVFACAQALLSVLQGDGDGAARRLGEVDAAARRLDSLALERFAHQIRALAAAARGGWEEAYREAAGVAVPGSFPPHAPQALWVAYDLVEAAVRTGRLAEARRHQTAMAAEAHRSSSPRLRLLAEAAGGLVAEPAGWVEAFERALATEGSEEWPFERARVLLAYGCRLRQLRHPIDARDTLHLALAIFERLGAGPWVALTRSELRLAHERGPAGSAAAALTPQELAVAELAASGYTNKQIAGRLFLSPRTVSGHLYRVFPKLGITSRSALRDALRAASGGVRVV